MAAANQATTVVDVSRVIGISRTPVIGAALGLLAAVLALYVNSVFAAVLLVAAPRFLGEPSVPRWADTVSSIVYAAVFVWLFERLPGGQPYGHRLEFVVASQVLSRAASVVLLWIARPAANAELPEVDSRGAIFAIVFAALSAALTGRAALLLGVAFLLTVRVAVGLEYQRWSGIRAESLGWVRQTLQIIALAIAFLPERFL